MRTLAPQPARGCHCSTGGARGPSRAGRFIIPLAIFQGAAVTWKSFLLSNLLPVTLGNIVGGALCVAGAFTYAFKKAE